MKSTEHQFCNVNKCGVLICVHMKEALDILESLADFDCIETHGFVCSRLDPEGGETPCERCRAKEFLESQKKPIDKLSNLG